MILDSMLYVGLTEKHDESARLFCQVIGRSSASPAFAFNCQPYNLFSALPALTSL